MISRLPRGIRNSNPFNVRISAAPWKGKIPVDANTDGAFEQFQSDVAGIRAGMKNMLTHWRRDKLCTLRKLITKHAPPNENDTKRYVETVAGDAGFKPDEIISLDDVDTLVSVARAVIRVENGQQPYSNAILQAAATAALQP